MGFKESFNEFKKVFKTINDFIYFFKTDKMIKYIFFSYTSDNYVFRESVVYGREAVVEGAIAVQPLRYYS